MPEGPQRSGLLLSRLPRLILPMHIEKGSYGLGNVSAAARATNEAILVPFQLDDFADATGLNWSVTVSAGNYDVGIYDANGTRLVSKGTTAVPAAGLASGAFTSTRLPRGRYFAAWVTDNIATAKFDGTQDLSALGGGGGPRSWEERGLFQMAAALPLPATVTFAAPAWVNIPLLALELA